MFLKHAVHIIINSSVLKCSAQQKAGKVRKGCHVTIILIECRLSRRSASETNSPLYHWHSLFVRTCSAGALCISLTQPFLYGRVVLVLYVFR